MRKLANFALVLAIVPELLAGNTVEKCSPQNSQSDQSSIYICDLVSKPERYFNQLVRVRARYLGGQIDTGSTLFGDECRSKSVEVTDPEDFGVSSARKILPHHDSPDQKRNRAEFYSLGAEMCGHGRVVGDYTPVKGTFTGVLM